MYSLKDLQAMNVTKIKNLIKEFDLKEQDVKDKNSLYFSILNAQASANGKLFAEGVIEVLNEGYGFLRFQEYSYLSSSEDIVRTVQAINAASSSSPIPRMKSGNKSKGITKYTIDATIIAIDCQGISRYSPFA